MTPHRAKFFDLQAHTALIGGLLLTLAGLGVRDHYTVSATADQVAAVAVDVKALLNDNARTQQRQKDAERERDELRTELSRLQGRGHGQ